MGGCAPSSGESGDRVDLLSAANGPSLLVERREISPADPVFFGGFYTAEQPQRERPTRWLGQEPGQVLVSMVDLEPRPRRLGLEMRAAADLSVTLRLSFDGEPLATIDQGPRWSRHLFELPLEHGSALRFFLEPIAVTLPFVVELHGYRRVHAIGLSGGGWTVTIYAALDPNVTTSFSVAGTQPVLAKTAFGDLEQRWMPLYTRASYLDLYALAAAEPDRLAVQVHHPNDPCCFDGVNHRGYAPAVQRRVSELAGGAFHATVAEPRR